MVAVTVWGLHGATIVYVEESPNRIHANVQPGGIFRMTNTATGALFAAFHSSNATEPVIRAEFEAAKLAGQPGSDFDEPAWRARVRDVRDCGYATTRDVPIPGVSAIAAPVFEHTGVMKLALTLIGPTGLIELGSGSTCVTQLVSFARTLSSDLGWGSPSHHPPQPEKHPQRQPLANTPTVAATTMSSVRKMSAAKGRSSSSVFSLLAP
jgi:DNA-binding IclR family transcriptional regulator